MFDDQAYKQELNAALYKLTEMMATEVIVQYDKAGLRASGRFAEEIDQKVTDLGDVMKLQVTGVDYSYFLEKGRKPTQTSTAGNPTVKQMIRQWIDDKNITPRDGISKDSLAYLISRKIHEQGIDVPNPRNDGKFIRRAVDKFYPLIADTVSDIYVKYITKHIMDELITK
jgi:hypothetical protein